jgi:hypothetical protein
MSYDATVFKVMIASPSDVQAERAIATEVLYEWNAIHSASRKIVLLPVAWETHSTPAMDVRPQAHINEHVLKDCDLLIGVFWHRLGTNTGVHASGTVEEIEEHLAANKPAMLYFSSKSVDPDEIDTEQRDRLRAFKQSCRQRGLCETFSTEIEFRAKLSNQIQLKTYQDRSFASPAPKASPRTRSLLSEGLKDLVDRVDTTSEKGKKLLREACSSDGEIMVLTMLDGTEIAAGSTTMNEGKDRRQIAEWEHAIEELVKSGKLKKDPQSKNECLVYHVTKPGFDYNDRQKST